MNIIYEFRRTRTICRCRCLFMLFMWDICINLCVCVCAYKTNDYAMYLHHTETCVWVWIYYDDYTTTTWTIYKVSRMLCLTGDATPSGTRGRHLYKLHTNSSCLYTKAHYKLVYTHIVPYMMRWYYIYTLYMADKVTVFDKTLLWYNI